MIKSQDSQVYCSPQLFDLDNLLRCHICKDFLNSPVLTPCGHTFCSLCIREYLNKESRCPLCLVELRESMLAKEFLVHEVTCAFKSLKSQLLKNTNGREPTKLDIPSRIHTSEVTMTSNNFKDEKDDDMLEVLSTNIPRKRCLNSDITNTKRVNNNVVTSLLKRPVEKVAKCPICTKLFPISLLERSHLDACLTENALEKESKEESPKLEEHVSNVVIDTTCDRPKDIFEPEILESGNQLIELKDCNTHTRNYLESGQLQTQNRLPKINFFSLSLSQLKHKLSSLGLPICGTRLQMINRYNHYEILWNSNFLDSLNPVSESELRRRLQKWEVVHNIDHSSKVRNNIAYMLQGKGADGSMVINRMKLFKTDSFDKQGWIRIYHKEFKELIIKAKKSLNRNKVHQPRNNYQTNDISQSNTTNNTNLDVTTINLLTGSDEELMDSELFITSQ